MSSTQTDYAEIAVYPTGSENWHSSGWEQPSPTSTPKKKPAQRITTWWAAMTELQLRGFIMAVSMVAAISLLGFIGQYWLSNAGMKSSPSLGVSASTSYERVTTTVTTVNDASEASTDSTSSAEASSTSATTNGKININKASASELEQLPGVGPATAAAIVTFRETNGNFQSVDELLAVDGIGNGKLSKMRDRVTI